MSDVKEPKTAAKKSEFLPEIKVTFTKEEKENSELRAGRVESYKVKTIEANDFHVEVEKVEFKPTDDGGLRKVSKPAVLIINPRTWLIMRKQLRGQGYKHVRVLHAPEGTEPKLLTVEPLKKAAEPKK